MALAIVPNINNGVFLPHKTGDRQVLTLCYDAKTRGKVGLKVRESNPALLTGVSVHTIRY